MSSFEKHTEEDSGFDEEPRIDIELGGDNFFSLTWHNTHVRQFDIGDGAYDHIVIMTEDESGIKQISTFRGTEEFRQMLIEDRFPHSMHPYLDEGAKESIALFQAAELEHEIQNL